MRECIAVILEILGTWVGLVGDIFWVNNLLYPVSQITGRSMIHSRIDLVDYM